MSITGHNLHDGNINKMAQESVLMKCGHISNATQLNRDGYRIPICVICLGIVDGADEVNTEVNVDELLKGRQASCVYCGKKVDSDKHLPFFSFSRLRMVDKYYCGCRGWD